jgi:hypothetical protein
MEHIFIINIFRDINIDNIFDKLSQLQENFELV